MSWLLEPLRRMYCALRGHDTILVFHQDRLSLRCLSCSYRTGGWSLRPDSFNTSSATHERLTHPARKAPHSLESPKVSSGASIADRSSRPDRDGRGSAAKQPSRAMRLAS